MNYNTKMKHIKITIAAVTLSLISGALTFTHAHMVQDTIPHKSTSIVLSNVNFLYDDLDLTANIESAKISQLKPAIKSSLISKGAMEQTGSISSTMFESMSSGYTDGLINVNN
ncbi:hypothetical protein [Veillonella agrestimuris]|uniref:hypothetical protein n=1 Tax=Veillonella agrestimuris TaxID=2941340 RepID=UPI00203AE303|nr:hypothetical protein [Veillonella agrestimuris]